jgi:hypothetical protein
MGHALAVHTAETGVEGTDVRVRQSLPGWLDWGVRAARTLIPPKQAGGRFTYNEKAGQKIRQNVGYKIILLRM